MAAVTAALVMTGCSGAGDAASPTASASSTSATVSGQAVPRGNQSGWKQVFVDDFSRNVKAGSFPGKDSSRWAAYDGIRDTSGAGEYSKDAISVHDGVMDLSLGYDGDQAISAAPVPLIKGSWTGQRYGRYSVRFKSDAVPGYKVAWLLWPDSNDWNDGEIDFPEASLTGTINANDHCVGDPEKTCFTTDTGVPMTSWHTATIEWTPQGVTYVLDGKQVGQSSESPSKAMHWVLQTETDGGAPPTGSSGHVYVDWVAIWARD